MDDEGVVKVVFQQWEKEWKEEKNNRVANIHNKLVETLAEEKAHVDEIIIALEILLRETIDAKIAQVRIESQVAVQPLQT